MARTYKHLNSRNKSYTELLAEAEYQTKIELQSTKYMPTEEEIRSKCEEIRDGSKHTNINRHLIKNPFRYNHYRKESVIPVINMHKIGLDNGLDPLDFC